MLNLTRILPPRPGTYLFWGDGGLATRERTTVPVDPEESFASIPVRGTSIPREWVTYCTVRLRRSEPKGDAPSVALLLLPVYYQEPSTFRLEALLFYCHPQIMWETLERAVRIELDKKYFSSLTLPEMRAVEKSLISRAALDRFTRALVANVTSQSTSGELEGPSNSNRIDPDILAAALREEHTYRLSEEVQKQFTEAESSPDIDWLDVVSKFQEEIAEKYSKSLPGVSAWEFLQAMRFRPILEHVPIWRKYNRAGKGVLEVGDLAPDCTLWEVTTGSGQYCWLSDCLRGINASKRVASLPAAENMNNACEMLCSSGSCQLDEIGLMEEGAICDLTNKSRKLDPSLPRKNMTLLLAGSFS